MIWIYYLLLLLLASLGLFVNVFGLPGLWLIVASLAGYAWISGFDVYVGWPSILTVLALAIFAEIAEFAAGSAGAAKAGGSKRAMIGAIIGALLGAALFSIPVPILGTIVGACLGAFIGASVVELAVRGGDVAHSFRVGTGAAKGRFYGIVIKLAFGCAMLLVSAIAAFPIASHATSVPAPNPATIPAPATLP